MVKIKNAFGKLVVGEDTELLKMKSQAAENSAEAIQIMDKDLKIVYYNDVAARISGITPQEAIGKYCYDVLPGKACHTDKCTAHRVQKEGRIQAEVKKHLIKTDEWIPVSITASPVKDSKGNVMGTIESLSDMRKVNSILDSMGNAVQVMDKDLKITYYNPAAARMTGIPVEEALGKHCYDILPGKACHTDKCTAIRVKTEGRIEVQGKKHLVKSDCWIDADIIAAPLKNEGGKIIGTIESINDITAVKAKEREMQELNDHLENTINKLLPMVEGAANGDLTIPYDLENNGDKLGKLSAAILGMRDNLKDIIRNINNTSLKLSSASEELAASSEEMNATTEQISNTVQEIASGAQKNAGQVEKGSQEMKKLSEMIREVADSANVASESAKMAEGKAKEGGKSAEVAAEKMQAIKDVSSDTAQKVKGLGKQSQEISKIVDVISNIAEQTNLLALNAAIEAARAGEHGKGFAVVAEEVRKLAEDSSKAAERISDMIKNIQIETEAAVKGMEKGTLEVGEGSEVVNQALEALSGIVSSVSDSTSKMLEITHAAQKQKEISEGVVGIIDDISTVAESTAAGAEETSAATEEQNASMQELTASAQELAKLSLDLQSIVGKFKIETGKHAVKATY